MRFFDNLKVELKSILKNNGIWNKNIPKLNISVGVFLILLIGILIRIVGISKMPNALNCDEASAGYEAFSILNYGIDRNGNFLPVFLVAWGSGQNALLTYLMIPFIKIFGLNVFAIRLPMVIISCISILCMYLLLRRISNKKLAFIGLAFFVICPWHIMKSRWGLESNLFPDLILIFVYLLVKSLEDENKILYYLSFIIAGVSAYAYGTSYFFLPIFLIPLLFILMKKQKINLIQALISLLIVGIVSFPIILMVIINTFDLQQINLPFMTIPKLEVNRFEVVTSIFSASFLSNSISNFIESFKVIITQTDGLPWNSILPFGTIYIFSIIFTIIGIKESFSKSEKSNIKYTYIFNSWFITCILLTFICEPNINRLNIIMFPIIYYTIVGIYIVIKELEKYNGKIYTIIILIVYLLSFILFINSYFMQDYSKYSTFENGFEEAIQYLEEVDDRTIYVTNKIKESYIYTLFYTKYDTRKFIDTVQYKDKYVEFRKVLSFGNYIFTDIEELNNSNNNIYVIRNKDKDKYNLDGFKTTDFKKYIVIEGWKNEKDKQNSTT